jgi:hypothetical protein
MAEGGKSRTEERPKERSDSNLEEMSIDRPRLTPQGRTDPEGGEDSTNPMGEGAKQGQSDQARAEIRRLEPAAALTTGSCVSETWRIG